METRTTYYEILNVENKASIEAIQYEYDVLRARFERALLNEQEMQEIEFAYNILMNSASRKAYDQSLKQTTTPFNGKDALILAAYYLAVVNFILPVIVQIIMALPYASMGMDIDAILASIDMGKYQFYVFGISTVIIYFFYRKKVKYEWVKFREYLKTFKFKVIKNYLMNMVVMLLINMFLLYVLNIEDTSDNQQAVEAILSMSPLLMGISTVIFAPLLEEIIFRGGLYLGLKEKFGIVNARLISIVIFAAIHMVVQLTDLQSIWHLFLILPYLSLSYFMVKSTDDTNSLFGGVAFHFINNLVATLVLIFM